MRVAASVIRKIFFKISERASLLIRTKKSARHFDFCSKTNDPAINIEIWNGFFSFLFRVLNGLWPATLPFYCPLILRALLGCEAVIFNLIGFGVTNPKLVRGYVVVGLVLLVHVDACNAEASGDLTDKKNQPSARRTLGQDFDAIVYKNGRKSNENSLKYLLILFYFAIYF